MTERRITAMGNQKGGSGKITTALNLSRAQLYKASLKGAKVTDEQRAEDKTLEGATMPDGTVYPLQEPESEPAPSEPEAKFESVGPRRRRMAGHGA